MIWNYRVFRDDDGSLSIREVFYEQDGTILACSEPSQIAADSISTLTELLNDLREALALPVLTHEDVPEQTKSDPRPRRPTLSHEAVLAELGLKHEDM